MDGSGANTAHFSVSGTVRERPRHTPTRRGRFAVRVGISQSVGGLGSSMIKRLGIDATERVRNQPEVVQAIMPNRVEPGHRADYIHRIV
jgi:hypothetical protein